MVMFLVIIVFILVSFICVYYSKGNVDFVLLKVWVVFILIGVFVGSYVVMVVNLMFFILLFGIIVILFVINMFIGKKDVLFKGLLGCVG